MNIEYIAGIYSLYPELSLKALRAGEYNLNLSLDNFIDISQRYSISYFVQHQFGYHYKLLNISSPPFVYYTCGDTSLLNRPCVAIVGPRKPTSYAYAVLDAVLDVLQEYDAVTISGLAPGVDQYVHFGSIDRGIPTIAILGSGLVDMMQSSKRYLVDRIINANGCVVSEFRLYQKPTHYTYPMRNRLVAGIADIVILPEAAEESGSLITAQYAIEMNKPLYVSPNSIFAPMSKGTNMLLQQGNARSLVDSVSVFDTYFTRLKSTEAPVHVSVDLSAEQRNLYTLLCEHGTMSIDMFLQHTSYSIGELQSILTMLELMGLVRQKTIGVYTI